MEQLDMHEFENDAIRKANLIKEGKRKAYSEEEFFGTFRKRRIVKKTAYLMRGMSFLVLFVFYITKLILIININNNTHCEHI